MTTLYLIRHGATQANLQRPFLLQGQRRDNPLADPGARQAERVRDLLRPLGLAAIYSSPLKRALATADILADGAPVTVLDALTEGDVGRWDGKSYEQIEREDAEAYRQFLADPAGHGYPEGENFNQILGRVAPALAQVAAAHEGAAIAVVTHQIVCRVYLGHLLGVAAPETRKLKMANGGISIVQFDRGAALVHTFNSAFHLAGVATPN
jgi:broad specificity phosphatase PhoE